MSTTPPLIVWLTATAVRSLQLGIDLTGIIPTAQVLALFLIGVALCDAAVRLNAYLEGGTP